MKRQSHAIATRCHKHRVTEIVPGNHSGSDAGSIKGRLGMNYNPGKTTFWAIQLGGYHFTSKLSLLGGIPPK